MSNKERRESVVAELSKSAGSMPKVSELAKMQGVSVETARRYIKEAIARRERIRDELRSMTVANSSDIRQC